MKTTFPLLFFFFFQEMYHTTQPFDPEGVLGTINSIVMGFLGMQVRWIISCSCMIQQVVQEYFYYVRVYFKCPYCSVVIIPHFILLGISVMLFMIV